MNRRVTQWIRYTFGISKSEANAYLVLLIILAGVHYLAGRLPLVVTSPRQPQYADSLVTNWYGVLEDSISTSTRKVVFDPNTISFDSLILFGIPRYTARNLIKYRKAGGTFREPKDIKKVYGFSDSLWRDLNQWIRINRQPTPAVQSNQAVKSIQETMAGDLNRVDTLWLKKIYGIGSILSRRIVKFRKLLGGYYSKNQLNEVYSLKGDALENLKRCVYVDLTNTPVHKLGLNQVNMDTLAAHPYISYKLAAAIVAYRDQHGPFQNLEDLKRIHLMDDSTYLRVSPYLDF